MAKIKWMGTLLVVSDLEKSKAFYQDIMEQELEMDTPQMVSFGVYPSAQLSLISADYYEQVSEDRWADVKMKTAAKTNNFQLYFEVNDLECYTAKIKATQGIELIYDIGDNFAGEHSFGQRGIRFYDFDGHLVEVAESLPFLAKRLVKQGLTLEEIAKQFGDSVEQIEELLLLD
jgi:catechol 2,3-dioxygenase-like lactoylglutathione lyase family enzyme